MDAIDTLIYELIELVKTTAPEVWRIAYKQVYALQAQDIVVSLFLGVGIYILIKMFNRSKEYHEENSYGMGGVEMFLCGLGILGSVIAVIVNLTTVAMRFINPEYYAIQLLLDFVSK